MVKGIYKFKEEFCAELKIPQNQCNRRQQELLDWLTNFFDYEILYGNPIRIIINEIYGEYQPLPRKAPIQTELNQKKEEDYTNFTIGALGTEFKPNSKSKIARDAIDNFGETKYYHTSIRAVAQRFIKSPFDKYGETNNHKIWVMYSDYTPLKNELLEEWRKILKEEHISEEEAACAFYKQAQGEDVEKELGYYKKAIARFKEKYSDTPVLVKEWKLKVE